MTRFMIPVCLVLSASAAAAEDGSSLMEEGAKLFLEGLMQEMEPTLRGLEGLAENLEPALRSWAQEMGPALQELLDTVEDWSAYEPPVVLPNGDILLKRKPLPDPPKVAPDLEEGEIDI